MSVGPGWEKMRKLPICVQCRKDKVSITSGNAQLCWLGGVNSRHDT